jgi:hypothetical protein
VHEIAAVSLEGIVGETANDAQLVEIPVDQHRSFVRRSAGGIGTWGADAWHGAIIARATGACLYVEAGP